MLSRVEILPRASASAEILRSASLVEKRFGIAFDAFAVFPMTWLKAMHNAPGNLSLADLTSAGTVVQDGARRDLPELTAIANMPSLTLEDRRKYLDIFLMVYAAMPRAGRNAITIAPRREGAWLARKAGWLQEGSLLPDMKRIALSNGLAVGIGQLPQNPPDADCCRIVDGAIASGATTLTLMEMFSAHVGRFEIFAVHCTEAAARALVSYASLLKIEIIIRCGFWGGTLNDHFYAVSEQNPSLVIIGDVGDTLSPLFE